MNGGNGQGETLADAQGKTFSLFVHDVVQSELLSHFIHPIRDILFRQIE